MSDDALQVPQRADFNEEFMARNQALRDERLVYEQSLNELFVRGLPTASLADYAYPVQLTIIKAYVKNIEMWHEDMSNHRACELVWQQQEQKFTTLRGLYSALLKQINEMKDAPEARDLAEMKRKAEEYDKMSKDYEESLRIGRTDSGDHVVMKHEKECCICMLRLEKMFSSTQGIQDTPPQDDDAPADKPPRACFVHLDCCGQTIHFECLETAMTRTTTNEDGETVYKTNCQDNGLSLLLGAAVGAVALLLGAAVALLLGAATAAATILEARLVRILG